jgi:hypothetical protein
MPSDPIDDRIEARAQEMWKTVATTVPWKKLGFRTLARYRLLAAIDIIGALEAETQTLRNDLVRAQAGRGAVGWGGP